ncbi:UDP-glucose 4-epimerase [Salinibacillus kushneri]|uniref:UDP-glucose 4-epimerase n=1 Tax=Salinibacillus kushneri TaxID=237682 RepID=A0A1I0AI02_9BACI|nr:NAD-dependent epimerase/dehydratase family protein [Salinibacillus kushneri]SES93323.1 UDP-glucose 4-epimerase [Salinibacillus kushneri]
MNQRSLDNRNVLVVGGAGFIGSHIVDKFLDEEVVNQVIIIDNLFTGKKENVEEAIDNGAVLYIDDAENQEILHYIIKEHDIDVVMNCATKALNYSFINPAHAFMTNVTVLKNLLELQRKKEFKTLCHLSSSEAYGSAQYKPIDEHHPLAPVTTYAAGKASADLMLQSYVQMFGLDAFILRPFNNYGPRQNFEGQLAGVVPSTIKKIINGDTPEIHGTGQQTRDFIYVEDNVNLIMKAFPMVSPGSVVNITTDQQLSIQRVVETIADVMGYKKTIRKVPGRRADVSSHRGSAKKLESIIGTFEGTPFKNGIIATVEWVKKRIT